MTTLPDLIDHLLTVLQCQKGGGGGGKREKAWQQSYSTWNHKHKLSPNRTGDLGPVYLLCQSKAHTARSCDQQKIPGQCCYPWGLSVHRH